MQIQVREAGAVQAVPRNACRPRIQYTGAIKILARRQRIRLPRRYGGAHPKRELFSRIEAFEQVQAMALVEIGPRPFARKVVLVCREPGDPARIIICMV